LFRNLASKGINPLVIVMAITGINKGLQPFETIENKGDGTILIKEQVV